MLGRGPDWNKAWRWKARTKFGGQGVDGTVRTVGDKVDPEGSKAGERFEGPLWAFEPCERA